MYSGGHVNVALFDQLGHLPKKGQQQCADMGAVHRYRSYDDLVVAGLVHIEFILADTSADGGDQCGFRCCLKFCPTGLFPRSTPCRVRAGWFELRLRPCGRTAGAVALHYTARRHGSPQSNPPACPATGRCQARPCGAVARLARCRPARAAIGLLTIRRPTDGFSSKTRRVHR